MSGLMPNPAQEAASRALRGPVLISAGAGSGKTRTLSERFAQALQDDPVQEWSAAAVNEVLTITFTEKAAGELAERVRLVLRASGRAEEARSVDSAWISTIHGFCSRVLRRYALEAGLDPSFGVADTVASGTMEEQALESAAREVLTTADGAMLFGDFEFAEVASAVRAVVRELRTRGMGADALRMPEIRPAADILNEARECFGRAGERVRACGDTRVSATGLAERCEAAGADLGCIDEVGMSEPELGRAVWGALMQWRPGRSSKAIAEIHSELKERHAELVADAAGAAAQPFAAAMVSLVSAHLRHYERQKCERGLLDFDDLQIRMLRLMEESPNVREECRAAFRMVMVDEFQDTDGLQTAIVSAVAGPDLCTVGDECQSIYRFRGADIDIYRTHRRAMLDSGARLFALTRNYRSHDDVLRFVNRLFGDDELLGESLTRLEHGRAEPDPSLVPDGAPRVDVVMVAQGGGSQGICRTAEADAVAERFAVLRDAFGVDPGDMVILVRAYTHADDYAAALVRRGFEAVVVGGSRFLNAPEIAAMRALLGVIANPKDEVALTHVLASDLGRLSDDGLWDLTHRRRESAGDLWAELRAAPETMSDIDAMRVRRVVASLDDARGAMGRRPLGEVLLRAVEHLGLDLLMLGRGAEGGAAYANVLKFARMATAFEESGGAGPAGFAAHLDAKEMHGEHLPPATLADDGARAVRIMSIHSAKGLEFPVVAAVGLGAATVSTREFVRVGVTEDGRMRIASKMADRGVGHAGRPALFTELDEAAKAADREEAKRVFYVACTRAKDVLVLSGVTDPDKDPDVCADSPIVWLRRACPWVGVAVDEGPRMIRAEGLTVRVEALMPPAIDTACMTLDADESFEPDLPMPVSGEAVTATAPSRFRVPRRLSYSDLALYLGCGLRFHAQRVLRVGGLRLPGDDEALRFGSAVHVALQCSTGPGTPSAERVAAIARGHEVPADRVPQIARAVEAFQSSPLGRELAAMQIVRREWEFAIALGDDASRVDLVGALDAYGRDGNHGLVVDYKTGESGEEAELAERYALQARCYALASLRDGCTSVRVVFTRPQRLDSEGNPQTVVYEFSIGDAASIELEILEMHGRMRAGEFAPLDCWQARTCGDCPIAGGICPVPVPG